MLLFEIKTIQFYTLFKWKNNILFYIKNVIEGLKTQTHSKKYNP